MCLPIRSILPLRLCFFGERGRALDGWDSARFLGIVLSFSGFPFLNLFSPAAGNAHRWAAA